MSNQKNMRRLSVLVTAQTAWNLEKLANMEGHRNIGKVINKLVREKMLALGDSMHAAQSVREEEREWKQQYSRR